MRSRRQEAEDFDAVGCAECGEAPCLEGCPVADGYERQWEDEQQRRALAQLRELGMRVTDGRETEDAAA